jgi:hypothetical protein
LGEEVPFIVMNDKLKWDPLISTKSLETRVGIVWKIKEIETLGGSD